MPILRAELEGLVAAGRHVHPDRRPVAGDPSRRPVRLRGAVQRGRRADRRPGPARGAPVLRELPRPAARAPDLPARPGRDAPVRRRRARPRVREPRDGRGRDPRRDRRRRAGHRGRRHRCQELPPGVTRRGRRTDGGRARGRRPAGAADPRPRLRVQPDRPLGDARQARAPWSPGATSSSVTTPTTA